MTFTYQNFVLGKGLSSSPEAQGLPNALKLRTKVKIKLVPTFSHISIVVLAHFRKTGLTYLFEKYIEERKGSANI